MKKFKTYGVWIDLRNAYLLEYDEDNIEIKEIVSNIDEGKLKGGHRSKTAYGPMDVSAEPQHNRRRQMQLDKYLINVMEQLKANDDLLIFGPGNTKTALEKLLKEKMPSISNLHIAPASKMTENQMKALVREKFQLS